MAVKLDSGGGGGSGRSTACLPRAHNIVHKTQNKTRHRYDDDAEEEITYCAHIYYTAVRGIRVQRACTRTSRGRTNLPPGTTSFTYILCVCVCIRAPKRCFSRTIFFFFNRPNSIYTHTPSRHPFLVFSFRPQPNFSSLFFFSFFTLGPAGYAGFLPAHAFVKHTPPTTTLLGIDLRAHTHTHKHITYIKRQPPYVPTITTTTTTVIHQNISDDDKCPRGRRNHQAVHANKRRDRVIISSRDDRRTAYWTCTM